MHRSAILLGIFLSTYTASATETVSRPGRVHTPPIRPLQKWNPLWSFGNVDDPSPPEWYRPGNPDRRMMWQIRNPLHNFTHYVAGVSDKDTQRTGRYPTHVFAPGGGWNWAFTRARFCPLPFLSFAGKSARFYLGWRESGNLGGKINFMRPGNTTPESATSEREATLKTRLSDDFGFVEKTNIRAAGRLHLKTVRICTNLRCYPAYPVA